MAPATPGYAGFSRHLGTADFSPPALAAEARLSDQRHGGALCPVAEKEPTEVGAPRAAGTMIEALRAAATRRCVIEAAVQHGTGEASAGAAGFLAR